MPAQGQPEIDKKPEMKKTRSLSTNRNKIAEQLTSKQTFGVVADSHTKITDFVTKLDE